MAPAATRRVARAGAAPKPEPLRSSLSTAEKMALFRRLFRGMWDKRQRGFRTMGYRMGIDATGDDCVSPGDLGKPAPATEDPMQTALMP